MGGNIDPTLRTLKSVGRYQLLQVLVISLGYFGAAYQLLGNIFIGRKVTWHQCDAMDNSSQTAAQLQDEDRNSSLVKYGACEITVSQNNLSDADQRYSCLNGYRYDFRKDMSFRTEFDLVCDRKLLGGLAQSFVIMGQGIGAVIASIFSDRFGRKKVLVASQLGLMTLGVAVGFSPSYSVLAFLKFVIGGLQQGVVTTSATMSIEWFPAEHRSLRCLIGSTMWGCAACSMALVAFLLRDYAWRYLQFALSGVSVLAFLQWWYLDESLRWLVANGRKEEAVRVLERAARVNRKDLSAVLRTLDWAIGDEELVPMTDDSSHGDGPDQDAKLETWPSSEDGTLNAVRKTADEQPPKKLTLLDLFRNKRLLYNAMIMWTAWFTCAFAFFALYMMSTSLHGNRFLNYFLTAVSELIPGFIYYFAVDRIGRKWATRPLYALAGFGLISSGVFRIFPDNSVLQTLSVASAMLGMVGASGMFGAIFFFTPELFPTNMRNQALGVASFAGRCGGMLAPFMTSLADIAVWAPGALIGSLCFLVVFVMRFLPETKGRELPNTVEDVKMWHQRPEKTDNK